MDSTQRLKDLAVSDSGFLFDPLSGATFTVNPSGRTILEGLKAGSGRDEIATTLEQSYQLGASADTRRDVDEFIQMLRQNDLLPVDVEL
jgi:PqqD family protein of HPr-rel-A system